MDYRKKTIAKSLERSEKIESEAKRFMTEPIITTAHRPVATTELINVNNDCLEKVFEYLPLEDLLNVADASKNSRPAVARVYHRQHITKAKDLKLMIQKYNRNGPIDATPHDIELTDLKTSFQLLRLFGYSVRTLQVNFNENIAHDAAVYRYINEYCSENLHEVHFMNKMPENGYPLGTFQNPFLNLETVTFNRSYLSGEITEFNKWFPNMRTFITMDRVTFTDPKCVEINFKSLETLRLSSALPRDSVEIALQLNPQLRKLELKCGYSGYLLEVATKYLVNLEQLTVLWEDYVIDDLKRISRMNGDKIYFPHLEKLYIYLENNHSYVDESVPLPNIPITFGPITEFHFYTRCTMGNEFVEFVKRHPTIKNIFVDASGYQGQHFLPLPFVMKRIFNPTLPIQCVGKFLDVFKYLQKYGTLQLYNMNDDHMESGSERYELENVDARCNGSLFHFKRVQ